MNNCFINRQYFGYEKINNICNGEEIIVPWTLLQYFIASSFIVIGLALIILVITISAMIIRS